MKRIGKGSKRVIFTSIAVISMFICVFVLYACGGIGKHKITYSVTQNDFANAPSYAAAGEEIEVICLVQVCDAEMDFYIDGAEIDAVYFDQDGYHIKFTMPDHDVTVGYKIVADPYGGA